MSHCASVLRLNGRSESSSFHADCVETFGKIEFKAQNKVIEPVEMTFCATNSFPTLKKYKFSEQENISCEFYKVKLGKQGLALLTELLSEVSDGFTATDKALSEASDAFTETDEVLSEPSDTLPATYKLLSEASDAFTATDKALSEVSDGLSATDRALSEASDGLPATDKTLSEASDAFTAIDRALSETLDGFTAIYKALSEVSDAFTASNGALSEPSDSLTATESRDNVGFDRQKSSVCEFCEAKLVKQGFALRLEPVEITNMETTAAQVAA